MAFNQPINLEILGRFNDEGIGFAFPTQTLYLAGDPNRPLDRRPEVERASRAVQVFACLHFEIRGWLRFVVFNS